jgi:SAM-dependent methyltransferase
MYDQVITNLLEFYNSDVERRDNREYPAWKREERQHFLSLLQQEGKTSLLEIGAGTGRDSQFFQQHGLKVISTDLSPEMVKRCQQNGLTAYVMDFLHLDFPPGSFDAIYSFNCLLHVPAQNLPAVLQKIQGLLKPAGLFYLGVYGGIEREGARPDDPNEPKRFFSFHTDEYMQEVIRQFFELLYFKRVHLEGEKDLHFQSMILRRS